MKKPLLVLLLLTGLVPPGCGGSDGPGYALSVEPDVVELSIVTGSVAYVNVDVIPDGFEGAVQVGFRDTSIEALPNGIRALSPCPPTGPEDGCDVLVDTVVSLASGETSATLAFDVASFITAAPGTEYTVEVAGAEASSGGRVVTTAFTLLLTD